MIQGTNIEWKGVYDNSGSPVGAAVERWVAAKGVFPLGLPAAAGHVTFVVLMKGADWSSYSWVEKAPYAHKVFEGVTLAVYKLDSQNH